VSPELAGHRELGLLLGERGRLVNVGELERVELVLGEHLEPEVGVGVELDVGVEAPWR